MTDVQHQTINIPSENTAQKTNETTETTVEIRDQQNNKMWKNDIQPNEEGIENFSFISNEDYRYISQSLDINQWYYDEFSGIYRQNEYGDKPAMIPPASLPITGSHSDISLSTESNKDSVTTTDSQASSIHRVDSNNNNNNSNNSNNNNGTNNVPSIDFHHTSSTSSLSTSTSASSHHFLNYAAKFSSSSASFIQSNSNKKTNHIILPFPWPETVDRIYEWCDLAKKSQDPNAKLKLCQRLLLTLSIEDSERTQQKTKHILQLKKQQRQQNKNNNHNNKYHKKSKSTSMIHHQQQQYIHSSSSSPEKNKIRKIMMTECLQLLKKLSGGQSLGKGGDSEAQYILANCYGMGLLGLTEDHSKAFQWYVQASKQSHPEATYRTAVCHELGIGTRKDGQRALVFYRKAAHLAHVGSMYKLGIILLRGYYHTPPMPREAISWLQRAVSHVSNQYSQQQPLSSTINGGDLLTRPSSMLTTLSNSTTTSSSSSSSSSSTNQRQTDSNNKNTTTHQDQDHNPLNNYSSSSSLSTSSSTSSSSTLLINQNHYESPHALHALAMVQLTGEIGNATNLIADPVYALELLHQAAQMGYIPSQVQLGHCYEHGQWVTMDDALSIYWYARAAEQGNPEGCLALSGWYLTGSTTKGILLASDREAYLWAHRAAITMVQATEKWTVAKAHFAVAVFLERGIGVKQDVEKAKKWMLRAAVLGHAGAKHSLLSHDEQKEWLLQQNKISSKINKSRQQQQQQQKRQQQKRQQQKQQQQQTNHEKQKENQTQNEKNNVELKNESSLSSSESSCIVM